MRMDNLENNKLIAEFLEFQRPIFMGGAPKTDSFVSTIIGYRGHYLAEELKFNTDWNWLMPVIEKIESLGYWVNLKRNYCLIQVFGNDYEAKTNGTYFVNNKQWANSKIEATYNACIEFIKWYNNQNSK